MVERIQLSPSLPQPLEEGSTETAPPLSVFVSRQLSGPSFASQAIRESISAPFPHFVEIGGEALEMRAGLDIEAANALAQAKSAVMGIVGGARDLDEARAEVFGDDKPLTGGKIAATVGARALGALALGSEAVGEAAAYITEELHKPITEKELEEPGYMQIPRALGTALKALPVGVGRAIKKWWKGEEAYTPSQAITEAVRQNTSYKDFKLPFGVATVYDIASDPLNLVGTGGTASGKEILKTATNHLFEGRLGRRALLAILLYHGDDEARLLEKAGTAAFRKEVIDTIAAAPLEIPNLREDFVKRMMRVYPGIDREAAEQLAAEAIKGSIANQAAPTLAEALTAYGYKGVKDALMSSGDEALVAFWKTFEDSLPKRVISRGAHTLQGGLRFAGQTIVPGYKLRPLSAAWQELSRSLPILSSITRLERGIRAKLSPTFRAAEWFRERGLPVDPIYIEHMFDAERFGRVEGKKFLDEAAQALAETGWGDISKESRERIYRVMIGEGPAASRGALALQRALLFVKDETEREKLLQGVLALAKQERQRPGSVGSVAKVADELSLSVADPKENLVAHSAFRFITDESEELGKQLLNNEIRSFDDLTRHAFAGLSEEELKVAKNISGFFATIPDIASKYGVDIPLREDFGWPRALSEVRKRAMEMTEEYAQIRRRNIKELLTRRRRVWTGSELPPDIFEQDPDRLLRMYIHKIRQDVQSMNFGRKAMQLRGLHGIPVALHTGAWMDTVLRPVFDQWKGIMQESIALLRDEVHDLSRQLAERQREYEQILPLAGATLENRAQYRKLQQEISNLVSEISTKAEEASRQLIDILSMPSELIKEGEGAMDASELLKVWDEVESVAAWRKEFAPPPLDQVENIAQSLDRVATSVGELRLAGPIKADAEQELFKELTRRTKDFLDIQAKRAAATALLEGAAAPKPEHMRQFMDDFLSYLRGKPADVVSDLAKAGVTAEQLKDPAALRQLYASQIEKIYKTIRHDLVPAMDAKAKEGVLEGFDAAAQKLLEALRRTVVADPDVELDAVQTQREFLAALDEQLTQLARAYRPAEGKKAPAPEVLRRLAADIGKAIDLGYAYGIHSLAELVQRKGIDSLQLFDQFSELVMDLGVRLPSKLKVKFADTLGHEAFMKVSGLVKKMGDAAAPEAAPEPFKLLPPLSEHVTDEVLQRRQLLNNTLRALSYISQSDRPPTQGFIDHAIKVAEATEGLRRAEQALRNTIAPQSPKAARDEAIAAAREITQSLLNIESETKAVSRASDVVNKLAEHLTNIEKEAAKEATSLKELAEAAPATALEAGGIIDPEIAKIAGMTPEELAALNDAFARIPVDASSLSVAWRELDNLERSLASIEDEPAEVVGQLVRRWHANRLFWHTTLSRMTASLVGKLNTESGRQAVELLASRLKKSHPYLAQNLRNYLLDVAAIGHEIQIGQHSFDLLTEIAVGSGKNVHTMAPKEWFSEVSRLMSQTMAALASESVHDSWIASMARQAVGRSPSKLNKAQREQLQILKTAEISHIFSEVLHHFVPGHWAATSVDEAGQALSASRTLAGMIHATVSSPADLPEYLLKLGFPERAVVDGYVDFLIRELARAQVRKRLGLELEGTAERIQQLARTAADIGERIQVFEDHADKIRKAVLKGSPEEDALIAERLESLAQAAGYRSVEAALAAALADPSMQQSLTQILDQLGLRKEAKALRDMVLRALPDAFVPDREKATAVAKLMRTLTGRQEVYSVTETWAALAEHYANMGKFIGPFPTQPDRREMADRVMDVLNVAAAHGVNNLESVLRATGRETAFHRRFAELFGRYGDSKLDRARTFSQFLDMIGFSRSLENTHRLGHLQYMAEMEGLPVPSEWRHVLLPQFATQIMRDLYEPLFATESVLDAAMRAWKIGKIGFRPGFHIRNFISNVWLLAASGWYRSPRELIQDFFEVMRGELSSQELEYIKAAGLLRRVATTGSLRNLHLWETPWGTFATEDLLGGIVADKAVLDKVGKPGAMVSNIIENIARLALAKRIIKEYAGTKAGSAQVVNTIQREAARVLFDYSVLTRTERQIRRHLSPFYTWLRNNLGFQLYLFSRRPVLYYNLMIAPTVVTAKPDERLGRQPYEGLPIRVGGKLIYLDLPTLDFLRAAQAASGVLAYTPIEPFKGQDKSELARYAGQVLGGPLVASAQWVTRTDLWGTRRLEPSEATQFLLRQLAPSLGPIIPGIAEAAGIEGGTAVSLIAGGGNHWSWLFGVKVEDVGAAKRREAFRRLTEAKEAAEAARARGLYIPPPPGKTYYRQVVPVEVEWYGVVQKLLARPSDESIEAWKARMVSAAVFGGEAKPPRMRPLREGEITERLVARQFKEFDVRPYLAKF
jgi:hypothetical protein